MELKRNNVITSLELLEQINFFRKQEEGRAELRHDTLMGIIKDEFEEEISLQKILESEYKNSRGKIYPMFVLTLSQSKQVLVRESKFVRKAVIKHIEELEEKLKDISAKDKLLIDLFSKDPIVVASAHKQLVELETKPLVENIERKEKVISTAINSMVTKDTSKSCRKHVNMALDTVCLEYCKYKKLNEGVVLRSVKMGVYSDFVKNHTNYSMVDVYANAKKYGKNGQLLKSKRSIIETFEYMEIIESFRKYLANTNVENLQLGLK